MAWPIQDSLFGGWDLGLVWMVWHSMLAQGNGIPYWAIVCGADPRSLWESWLPVEITVKALNAVDG